MLIYSLKVEGISRCALLLLLLLAGSLSYWLVFVPCCPWRFRPCLATPALRAWCLAPAHAPEAASPRPFFLSPLLPAFNTGIRQTVMMGTGHSKGAAVPHALGPRCRQLHMLVACACCPGCALAPLVMMHHQKSPSKRHSRSKGTPDACRSRGCWLARNWACLHLPTMHLPTRSRRGLTQRRWHRSRRHRWRVKSRFPEPAPWLNLTRCTKRAPAPPTARTARTARNSKVRHGGAARKSKVRHEGRRVQGLNTSTCSRWC